MKIRVAYTEKEKMEMRLLKWVVKRLFSNTKVRETAPKDGYMHTVLTVPEPKDTTK